MPDPVVTNGCTGHCCVAFYLSKKNRRLLATSQDPDALTITDMLIPLTVAEANERLDRFGAVGARYESDDEGVTFTCRHFDEERMLCKIYPVRPLMCVGYPYENGCDWGCEHEGVSVEELIKEASEA